MELTENQAEVLRLANEEYARQRRTWALDRALEVVKSPNYSGQANAESLIAEAETLVNWIDQFEKTFPIPSDEEAQMHLDKFKKMGEI